MAVANYVFTTLDDPSARSDVYAQGTFAEGINNFGEVAASYVGNSTAGQWLGFTYWHGNYSTQDIPSSYETLSQGINDLGQVVGWYNENSVDYAYEYQNGVYTTLPTLSPTDNFAEGINDRGQIVGYYQTAFNGDNFSVGRYNGFLHSGPAAAGSYLVIDDPLAARTGDGTVAKGVNNSDEIVGYYWDAQGLANGFLYQNGAYTTIDDPLGTDGTFLTGINDKGTIVGYYDDSLNVAHGFEYSHGQFTTIDVPVAGSATYLTGINDLGIIVGTYAVDNVSHGFIGTPHSTGAHWDRGA